MSIPRFDCWVICVLIEEFFFHSYLYLCKQTLFPYHVNHSIRKRQNRLRNVQALLYSPQCGIWGIYSEEFNRFLFFFSSLLLPSLSPAPHSHPFTASLPVSLLCLPFHLLYPYLLPFLSLLSPPLSFSSPLPLFFPSDYPLCFSHVIPCLLAVLSCIFPLSPFPAPLPYHSLIFSLPLIIHMIPLSRVTSHIHNFPYTCCDPSWHVSYGLEVEISSLPKSERVRDFP